MFKPTISRTKLLKAGYKEYSENLYQKLIKDEHGKRYFINVRHDLFGSIDMWTFESMFKWGYQAVNVELVQWFNDNGKFTGARIKDAEYFFEKQWQVIGYEYYEVY